jgi:hypothetical protein
MTKAEYLNQIELKNTDALSIEEIFAPPESPRIWLDNKFEEPLERALAIVESRRFRRGSKDWRHALESEFIFVCVNIIKSVPSFLSWRF